MNMNIQDPYEIAGERGFPVQIAYLCFALDSRGTIAGLVDLVPHLLKGSRPVMGVLLSAFSSRDRIFQYREAKPILSARVAEACAFFRYDITRCPETDLMRACRMGEADEGRIVTELWKGSVALFHDGHCSVELLGDSEHVRRCATFLLQKGMDTFSGDRGVSAR